MSLDEGGSPVLPMASRSLEDWQKLRGKALDQVESAIEVVGGKRRGRRHSTQQLNRAYALLVSSQFQGFCRDLHSEAVDHLVSAITPAGLQPVVRMRLTEGRHLDRGNANPSNLGADFSRLGMSFWDQVKTAEKRSAGRQKKLGLLNDWRNAIAHDAFDPDKLGSRLTLHLSQVRAWRAACDGLARVFDRTVADHLTALVGARPW